MWGQPLANGLEPSAQCQPNRAWGPWASHTSAGLTTILTRCPEVGINSLICGSNSTNYALNERPGTGEVSLFFWVFFLVYTLIKINTPTSRPRSVHEEVTSESVKPRAPCGRAFLKKQPGSSSASFRFPECVLFSSRGPHKSIGHIWLWKKYFTSEVRSSRFSLLSGICKVRMTRGVIGRP